MSKSNSQIKSKKNARRGKRYARHELIAEHRAGGHGYACNGCPLCEAGPK